MVNCTILDTAVWETVLAVG